MALYSCSSDTTNIIDDDNDQEDTTSIITSEDFYNSFDDTEGTDNYIENGATHEDKANDYSYNESSVIDITLNTNAIISSSENVTINGTLATITRTGTYRISGTLDDGQIIVDSDDEETIKIIFDGININNSTNSPFAIMGAEKTVILLSDNSQNYLSDTSNYIFEEGEDEPDATLFSKDNLTIYGTGMLTVSGNYNEAIKSKDALNAITF
ncbi:MAG: carbohydrate-binding domain-containing protein [Flavobacteriaceae bacterium]